MAGITPMASVILIACSACIDTHGSPLRPSYSARNREAASAPVNAIIGDAGFVARFGRAPDRFADEDLRIATHLEFVERMLRSRDVTHLSHDLLRERLRNLDRLHAYRIGGIFPRNYDVPGRRPCFIDRDGRICAVGYLVACSAGLDAAAAIDARYHNAYIAEMSAPLVERWIARSGLTREEAAMIQPTYGGEVYRSPLTIEQRTLVAELGGTGVDARRMITRREMIVADSAETWTVDTLDVGIWYSTGHVLASRWRSDGAFQRITASAVKGDRNADYNRYTLLLTERGANDSVRRLTAIEYPGIARLFIRSTAALIVTGSGGATLEQTRECVDPRLSSLRQSISFDAASGYAVVAVATPMWFLVLEGEGARRGRIVVEDRSDSIQRLTIAYADSMRGYFRTMTVCGAEVVEDQARDFKGAMLWQCVRDSARGGYIGTRYEYDPALTGRAGIPSAEASYRYATYADAFNGAGDYIRLVRRVADFDERGNWIYLDEHMRYYDATGAATYAETVVTRAIEYETRR
jgi:hypothetical protein